MIGRLLDSVIGEFAPAWGAKRAAARATMAQIESMAGTQGGYAAGKLNRFNKGRGRSDLVENAIPREQLERLRGDAWDLYRNNPHARKIVRSLQAKVVGKGLDPSPQATKPDGTAHVEFRKRARELWNECKRVLDLRGRSGRGGQTLGELQRLALKATILSGETLARTVPISEAQQKQRRCPVPVLLQLIPVQRLASEPSETLADGHSFFRGIELDAAGLRVAYWIDNSPPGDPTQTQIKRIPAATITHLYVEEDIDQLRGVSWFAPLLLPMRDTGDYQYNEIKAAAMAACIVLGYRRATGTRNGLGLNTPESEDLLDADGNKVNRIQPGMFVNLGRDGALEGFNPSRSGANAADFIGHMYRSTAVGAPGTKSSTLTGDYRNASFSSEKSADNDTWPEIEALQDWFAEGFCQPLYADLVAAGIESGWFAGIVSAEEFQARRDAFCAASWQGPVARAINPVQEAKAPSLRIAAGTSSPQRECAKEAVDWRAILGDMAEFYKFAIDLGLPEAFVNNILSIDAQDVTPPADGKPAGGKPAAQKTGSQDAQNA